MSALSTAFIPLYTKIKARDEDESSICKPSLKWYFGFSRSRGASYLRASLVPLYSRLNSESLELAIV